MSNRKRTTRTSTSGINDIRQKAMLVRLRIHRWGAKVNDAETAREVAERKKADPQLGRYTKLLLKSDALDKHRKCSRKARKTHKYYTAPWDDGVGILPAKLWFTYQEEVGKHIREADNHAKEFVTEYTQVWQSGLKEYRDGLGDMFKAAEYPDPSRVKAKFGISVRTMPIVDANDFRVKMSADVSSSIREQMQKDIEESLRDALRDPMVRLYEIVNHLNEKLKDREAIFRDSAINNIRKLVDILPDLNVLDDPKVAAIIKETDKKICSVHDVGALRTDTKYRQDVAKSAQAILKQMKGYIS